MTTVEIILVVMFLLCLANQETHAGDVFAVWAWIIWTIVSLIIVFGWIMGLLDRLRPF